MGLKKRGKFCIQSQVRSVRISSSTRNWPWRQLRTSNQWDNIKNHSHIDNERKSKSRNCRYWDGFFALKFWGKIFYEATPRSKIYGRWNKEALVLKQQIKEKNIFFKIRAKKKKYKKWNEMTLTQVSWILVRILP